MADQNPTQKAADRCPTCGSPKPELHPATALEGEVGICKNDFHFQVTASNTPSRIEALRELIKREVQPAYVPAVPDAFVCPKCGAEITKSDDLASGMIQASIEGLGIHFVYHRTCGCPLPHLLVPVQPEKSMLI